MTEQTYYRPGLIFLSKHAGLNVPIKDPEFHTYPDGTREAIRPNITADFGAGSGNVLMGPEVTRDEHGKALPRIEVFGMDQPYSFEGAVADIRGGVLVLDEFAERLGLTEEERETAARKLVTLARDPRTPEVTLWEPPAPSCPIPEDVYAGLHPSRVLALASETGQLNEFLSWELHTLKRPEVVGALQKKLRERADAERADEALSAA